MHGGAISVRGASYEPPFTARESQLSAEKQRIAAKAVEMISDGDSLILDVGTTTLEIARALKGKRNLTVLVTSLRAALEPDFLLEVLAGDGTPRLVSFGYSDDEAFAVGLTCGGTIHLFIEPLDW